MPPNRKASLRQEENSLRFVLHAVAPAKDHAPHSNTALDRHESYWTWPTSVTTKEHLLSANHIVANLVRDASLIEAKGGQVAVVTSCSDDYWNDERSASRPTAVASGTVDDTWTSGCAIEQALLRHAAALLPLTTNSNDDVTSNNDDMMWNWVTFPHSAQHERLRIASTTTPICESHHDDYGFGL